VVVFPDVLAHLRSSGALIAKLGSLGATNGWSRKTLSLPGSRCVGGYVHLPSTKQQYHLRLGGMRRGMTTNVQLSRAMLTLSTGRHLSAGGYGSTDSNPVAPHSATMGTSIRTM